MISITCRHCRLAHIFVTLMSGAAILSACGQDVGQPEQASPINSKINSEMQTVEMGVINNKIPEHLTIDYLKRGAVDQPTEMVGLWTGQFRKAQWDDQSDEIKDIEIEILFDGQIWQIKGETLFTDRVSATEISFNDRTLSFGLDSGLFNGDQEQFPYLVDLVKVDDQLRGLIRLRLRTVGEFDVDRNHILWLEKKPPQDEGVALTSQASSSSGR